ncbi:MAG: 4-(cytidine 5'-diphospho)-2-C-methyl-D-erythritol kinase, partial [Oscillospiraceae bacterium]|nr:4-(cytidine 5'-diphospho)-2-C-methyl-D-erythritol kinase [Oscillospiraceae bacterium]
MNSLTVPAYAKLNLTLDILRRRDDGYHDLQMVMQSVSLHDDVTVTLTDGAGIVCRCGDIPGDESNLAVRAARAFFAETGVAPRALDIDVVKRIPAQAGMAGGSTDGAAVLRALR